MTRHYFGRRSGGGIAVDVDAGDGTPPRPLGGQPGNDTPFAWGAMSPGAEHLTMALLVDTLTNATMRSDDVVAIITEVHSGVLRALVCALPMQAWVLSSADVREAIAGCQFYVAIAPLLEAAVARDAAQALMEPDTD